MTYSTYSDGIYPHGVYNQMKWIAECIRCSYSIRKVKAAANRLMKVILKIESYGDKYSEGYLAARLGMDALLLKNAFKVLEKGTELYTRSDILYAAQCINYIIDTYLEAMAAGK